MGIRKSGVERSKTFITGKLWNTKHVSEDVEKGLDKTLNDISSTLWNGTNGTTGRHVGALISGKNSVRK